MEDIAANPVIFRQNAAEARLSSSLVLRKVGWKTGLHPVQAGDMLFLTLL
jgi:hypothetical protein